MHVAALAAIRAPAFANANATLGERRQALAVTWALLQTDWPDLIQSPHDLYNPFVARDDAKSLEQDAVRRAVAESIGWRQSQQALIFAGANFVELCSDKVGCCRFCCVVAFVDCCTPLLRNQQVTRNMPNKKTPVKAVLKAAAATAAHLVQPNGRTNEVVCQRAWRILTTEELPPNREMHAARAVRCRCADYDVSNCAIMPRAQINWRRRKRSSSQSCASCLSIRPTLLPCAACMRTCTKC